VSCIVLQHPKTANMQYPRGLLHPLRTCKFGRSLKLTLYVVKLILTLLLHKFKLRYHIWFCIKFSHFISRQQKNISSLLFSVVFVSYVKLQSEMMHVMKVWCKFPGESVARYNKP
jgi:hypothetical protein